MPFKIIYIDDEPDLLEIFKDLFSKPGIEISTFEDFNEARNAVLTNPPDLLLIDYRLKGQTGENVARLFDKSIPKAMITGELNLNLESEIFKKIFYKPYNVGAVENFINQLRDPHLI